MHDDSPSLDTASPAPARAGSRSGLSIWIVLSTSLFSLAIALFVAWFVVVRPKAAEQPQTIGVEKFLSGSANGATAGADAPVAKGSPVPNVTFERLDGSGTLTIAGFLGKPLVINFWASSCTPCLREMPLFEEAHRSYGDQVNILGVDTSEGADAGQKMVGRTGVTYDQVSDPQGEHVIHFGGSQLPHTVIVAANGTITEIHDRVFTSASELRTSIDAALAVR